ncbi:hypothetical protein CEXT_359831 [Caerostris extrusa]|uniref:Uncharacterized protein n=1 Tax=Caerostris extrusa TaxID=172846 RepID=A0AAV4SH04_CAEEX|nr:hypothetical protein CEXT_359831 [Caerostris extrusa]
MSTTIISNSKNADFSKLISQALLGKRMCCVARFPVPPDNVNKILVVKNHLMSCKMAIFPTPVKKKLFNSSCFGYQFCI